MPSQHSARLLLIVSAALLAACGGSGTGAPTPQPSASTRAESTPPSLPFHYSAAGESSSPTFHVAQAGSYTVAYTITGSAQQPDCTVSIGLVADDGDSRQVLGGVKLAPATAGRAPCRCSSPPATGASRRAAAAAGRSR